MAHAPGSFCWFELATTDQDGAKRFYQTLFGWNVQDSPMGPNELYSMFTLGGADVGAAYTMRKEQRDQGVPPNWLVYVAVTDAELIAERAATLGGMVLSAAFKVGEFGRMAVLQDPTGAVFAVWEAKEHAGTGTTGRVENTMCWADLYTTDQDRAAAFYSDLFGWKMVSGRELLAASPGDYYHIANGRDLIGGIMPATSQNPEAPPHWLVYVAVPDCAGTEAHARSLGANVYASTFSVGAEGSVAILADPQGAVFGIHQQG